MASRGGRPVLLMALTLHLIYIAERGFQVGTLPLTTMPDTLSTVAFALGLVYLYLEYRQDTPMTGVFVLPIVAFLTAAGFMPMHGPPRAPGMLLSPWFALHTLTAVTSYCAFALAAVYGLLFLLLYHELKAGRFSLLYHRLPSLEQLGQLAIRSTVAGFILLGVAILIGGIWIAGDHMGYFTDPKVLLTLIVWLIFGAAILAHYRWERRGPLPVYLSLAGFAMLMVSAVVAMRFTSSFHRFH